MVRSISRRRDMMSPKGKYFMVGGEDGHGNA